MWYSNLYRRHLLDMHIEDWDESFLSEFSPENYIENLKKAQINYAMIYFQSHAGLCYFPTKVGTIHKAFEKAPDKMKRLVDLCHENDIKVCGYYSLFYNTREHDNHPEWKLINKDGKSNRDMQSSKIELDFSSAGSGRYGLLCPNNPEYIDFVNTQIDEMLDYFDVDAMFFDMPFWAGTCFCKHCQEDYKKTTGHSIPILSGNYIDLNNEDKEKYLELTKYRYMAMGRTIRKITDHLKKRFPDMPVEHNYASSIASASYSGCGDEVADCCDYVGGDLYGDMYRHSFATKYFKNISKNQPFEQMFSRCKPSLGTHTLTKTLDQMKIALSSTIAHHGATLVIDAIDPVGTMDTRVYERIGDLFDFQKPYEPFFNGKMVSDIGIYYGVRSNQSFKTDNARDCSIALSTSLIKKHIPFDITGSFEDLSKYEIIFASMLGPIENTNDLVNFVENGGTLYLSGFNNKELVEKLTGNKFLGITDERNTYLSPTKKYLDYFDGFNEKYPLPFNGQVPLVKAGKDVEIIATLTLPYTKPTEIKFASIHSNPPGIKTEYPVMTINNYGKGKVIWSGAPIENSPYLEYTSILLNIIEKTDYSFITDAPETVEVTLFNHGNYLTVSAYLMADVHTAFTIMPFTVKIKCNKKPADVVLLPANTSTKWEYKDGYVIFKTRELNIFDMYQIKF